MIMRDCWVEKENADVFLVYLRYLFLLGSGHFISHFS
jgi:hypothetical protein